MQWLQLSSVTAAAFFASLVEFVEALTIVLAVGTTRGWRSAFLGTIGAVLSLTLTILILGTSIEKIPIHWMQLGIGAIVLVFGFRWLKKATLRSAGRIPMHDELKEYQKTVNQLTDGAPAPTAGHWDMLAIATTFKAVFLEGFEVVFIVVTAGTVSGGGSDRGFGHYWPAASGAAAALLVVVVIGLLVHQPLSRVPENTLKKTVGVLLTSFGIFWVGEGLGFKWPFDDAFVLFLVALLTVISLTVSSRLARRSLE